MKLASLDPAREKELLDKYKDYRQIPFVMSPKALENYFRDHKVAPSPKNLIITH